MLRKYRWVWWTLVAAGVILPAGAQTPFERLFDPRTAVSIVLEMPQATWSAMASEQPAGGPCNFAVSPTTDRYMWRSSTITIITERDFVGNQQVYANAGVKKKSFCGSLDNTKPSLSINLTKHTNANSAAAEAHLGTVHLSLENSKQDAELFRQCAGYYIYRSLGMPAPMCSFAALYRRDTSQQPLVFLGLYVLTEPVKKDFFRRRPSIETTPAASLYELEYQDDFTTATLNTQLQVEWSATGSQDFGFAVNQVQTQPVTGLAKSIDLPAFIDFWAAEIFLKHWDGFTGNQNNTFVYDDTPQSGTIQKTRFRFIPHGVDQILAVNAKPGVWLKSIVAQRAYADNGLRFQLHRTLASYGSLIAAADVPGHIESYVPLVLRLWRGPDALLGPDSHAARKMAETVKVAVNQAIVDVQSVFGEGLLTPSITPARLVSPSFVQCATRITANAELGRANCSTQPGQQWVFDSMPLSMGSTGFAQPLPLYGVRNQGTQQCLQMGPQFIDGSKRWKLMMATCSAPAAAQKFFFVRREGRAFELRSFAVNACMHFSGSVLTTDGRRAVYLGECDNDSKKLLVAE